MEVHFSPEKKARIHQFAMRTGKDTAQVVEEAVDRLLEHQARLIEAVEKGRAAARHDDLLDHNEVGKRIEQIFSERWRGQFRPAERKDQRYRRLARKYV